MKSKWKSKWWTQLNQLKTVEIRNRQSAVKAMGPARGELKKVKRYFCQISISESHIIKNSFHLLTEGVVC